MLIREFLYSAVTTHGQTEMPLSQ